MAMTRTLLCLVLALTACSAHAAVATLKLSDAEVAAIEAASSEDPFPEATLGDPYGKLAGFFVMPCRPWYSVEGRPVSMLQTRYYSHESQTYQVDTTYYVNDTTCTPNNSDVYLKTYFEGTVSYNGKNKVVKDATMANLTWTSGTYYFSDVGSAQYTIAQLNHYCPCGGEWKAGTERTVAAKDCGVIDPGSPNLCHIIGGDDDLFNYRWLDSTHYITSQDCFEDDTACYNNPLIENYVRERIPESGNTNPDSCDYKLWAQCGAGVEAAAKNCETCKGLECDGCLFKELNPDWDPSSHSTDHDDWYSCCPCIYYYAEKYEKEWLQTKC